MKKIVIVSITIILLTGIIFSIHRDKKTQNDIETIIRKDQYMVISVNYPKTNIKKLDHQIKKQVDQIYKNFIENNTIFKKDNEQSELNIDYEYKLIDERYINIVLESFTNNKKLIHPQNKIYNYVFDIKENHFLSLKDLVKKEELKKIVIKLKQEIIKQYPNSIDINKLDSKITPDYKTLTNFTFDTENLTFYFNPSELILEYPHIIDIKIPLENINLNLEIELGMEDKKMNKVIKTETQSIDPNKKMISITFDDGPGKYTKDILKILKKNNAYATFFVLGNKVEMYNESTREIIKQGSEIGNHSYNHKWLIKLKKDDFINQVNMTQDIIERTTGYRPTLLRPTYGDVNDTIKENTDLDIILWNIDTLDWKIKDPKKIANRVIGKVEDGDIVLMHDIHRQTVEALKIILPKLKEEGYQFVTVSELKEARTIKKYNVTK